MTLLTTLDSNCSEPEHDAAGRPREVEAAEIDAEPVGPLGALEAAEVADVALDADAIGEKDHHAAPDVSAKIIVLHREEIGRVLGLRPDEAEPAHDVRPDALSTLSADRHADDHVAHQGEHTAARHDLRVALIEEIRREAEIDFTAHNALAHAAERHAGVELLVSGVPAEVGARKRRDEPVRCGPAGRRYQSRLRASESRSCYQGHRERPAWRRACCDWRH